MKKSEQGIAEKQPGESILDYARRTRYGRKGKPTAKEIREFEQKATPANTSLDEAIRFAKVFHNSPYLLKNAEGAFVDPESGERLGFDHRFMGRGEGAQAHGWGSYFSVNDLAKYGGATSVFDPEYSLQPGVNEEQRIDKEDYDSYTDEEKAWADHTLTVIHLWNEENIGEWAYDPLEAISNTIYAFMEDCGYPDMASARERFYDGFIDFYRERLVHDIYGPRHKYSVEIPDNNVINYLEESGLLEKGHIQLIEEQLQKESTEDRYGDDFYQLFETHQPEWRMLTMGDLYDRLAEFIYQTYETKGKKKAAEWANTMMNEAGFAGIHYIGDLDGECYVIFNEEDAKIVDHVRFRKSASSYDEEGMANRREVRYADEVNKKYNEELERLNERNKDNVRLNLGYPSPALRAGGVRDLPMLLYGNKLWAKMKKHGYRIDELRNLPLALQDPIAVFNTHGDLGTRAILTELKTNDGNFLATVDIGNEGTLEINVITSVYGKGFGNVLRWILRGNLTYVDKEKVLHYLESTPAPIAGALTSSEELLSVPKVVNDFENPKLEDDPQFRKSAPFTIANNDQTHQLNAKQAKNGTQEVVTEEDIRFRLTKRGKTNIESWLKKRKDENVA